ncbi:MAG: electron transport complex subunit RsxG [Xanthomonadales bacterium]|nr:electron transport complex subunit RsxG [Xanthomonadales bacterium]
MNAVQPGALRSGVLLAGVAVLGSALLASVHMLTEARIEEQERRAVLERLHQVMPDTAYDNELHEDYVTVTEPDTFRHDGPVTIYRARRNGEPVGAILRVTAPDGYNGDIEMLVGVYMNGNISGVRITRHRETPGLGDPIERRRSPWILAFDGRSLSDPPRAGWAVKRDGGIFDQFTGATITPRAVVEAVERSLLYFEYEKARLFEQGATTTP